MDIRQLSGLRAWEKAATIAAAVGEETIAWLRQLPVSYRSGDYFFCHAGIRPGLPLSKQKPEDLMWVREEFLLSDGDHGAVVVHGHTETRRPEDAGNRINVDTGAHRTGVLTAAGLEGASKWFLATEPAHRQMAAAAPLAPESRASFVAHV